DWCRKPSGCILFDLWRLEQHPAARQEFLFEFGVSELNQASISSGINRGCFRAGTVERCRPGVFRRKKADKNVFISGWAIIPIPIKIPIPKTTNERYTQCKSSCNSPNATFFEKYCQTLFLTPATIRLIQKKNSEKLKMEKPFLARLKSSAGFISRAM